MTACSASRQGLGIQPLAAFEIGARELGLTEHQPHLPSLFKGVLEVLACVAIDGVAEVGVRLGEVALLFVGDSEPIEADAEPRLGHGVLEGRDPPVHVARQHLGPPEVPQARWIEV